MFFRNYLLKSHLISTSLTDALLVVLATISGIFVTRLLGPQGRGEYAVITLWPSLIAAVGNLGLREAFTYEMAQGIINPAQLNGHAILIGGALSIIGMILGVIFIPILTDRYTYELTITSMTFLLFIPTNILTSYGLGILQGNQKIHEFNFLRLTVNIIYLVGVILLWITKNLTVRNVMVTLLMSSAITALLTLFLVLNLYKINFSLDKRIISRLVSYGIRNHIGSLSFLFNQRLDQMLMTLLISPINLGLYAAAVNVSGMARLLSGAISTLVFPRVAAANSTEKRNLVLKYSKINATLTFISGVGLVLVNPWLIPLIYGPAYRPSIIPAQILTIAAVIVGIAVCWSSSLRGLGHPIIPAKAEFIALFFTLIGLLLTLPTFGILGASWTSLAAYTVSTAYMLVHLRILLNIKIRDVLSPVSLATIFNNLLKSNY
jgi:O-antigen/teichoic acid export membrane protein